MGVASGLIAGFAVYRQSTSVNRNSQSAFTNVATCRDCKTVLLALCTMCQHA